MYIKYNIGRVGPIQGRIDTIHGPSTYKVHLIQYMLICPRNLRGSLTNIRLSAQNTNYPNIECLVV